MLKDVIPNLGDKAWLRIKKVVAVGFTLNFVMHIVILVNPHKQRKVGDINQGLANLTLVGIFSIFFLKRIGGQLS